MTVGMPFGRDSFEHGDRCRSAQDCGGVSNNTSPAQRFRSLWKLSISQRSKGRQFTIEFGSAQKFGSDAYGKSDADAIDGMAEELTGKWDTLSFEVAWPINAADVTK